MSALFDNNLMAFSHCFILHIQELPTSVSLESLVFLFCNTPHVYISTVKIVQGFTFSVNILMDMFT